MKRLISLNLALILVMSLLVCPIIATSSPVYEITVNGVSFSSDSDNSGDGWKYNAESATNNDSTAVC